MILRKNSKHDKLYLKMMLKHKMNTYIGMSNFLK